MSTNYTTVDHVNFRSSAGFEDNVIGSLHLAQNIQITGTKNGDRWMPAQADINGTTKTGFISENVIRNPLSTSKEALVQESVKQWLRFHRGTKKEYQQLKLAPKVHGEKRKYVIPHVHIEPYIEYVGEFWKSIGMDLDGLDRDQPWSAAFISYVVKKAGGYDGFKYAAAHARYCHEAIRAKLDNEPYPFWGFKINDHKPQLGDMVCRWRSKNISYNYAANDKYYKSHCDIVVQVAKDHVLTIGGNVGQSVRHTKYAINSNGLLTGKGNVYAVLRNNL